MTNAYAMIKLEQAAYWRKLVATMRRSGESPARQSFYLLRAKSRIAEARAARIETE